MVAVQVKLELVVKIMAHLKFVDRIYLLFFKIQYRMTSWDL